MNSPQNIQKGIDALMILSSVLIIQKANPAVSDFFTSNVMIFILVALYTYKTSDNNILVSLATAFFAVILVKIITAQDYNKIMEGFELIYPGPTSSPNCLNIGKNDLIKHFNGNENDLKRSMVDSGVPMNLELNDVNAPEIATYLINNPQVGAIGDCKLIIA